MPGAGAEIVETQARRAKVVAVAAAFLGLVWPATLALSHPVQMLRHPAVIDSAYFAFALWAGASVLILQVPQDRWKAGQPPVRAVQWVCLLAWLLFAVHVGYAFYFSHGMSHAQAMAHVQATAGYGEGIFVSYAFTLIWLLDVLWLSFASASFTRRPRWLGYGLQGFFAFITFNGTVVYGHGFMRWVCLGVFVYLLVQWLVSQRGTVAGPTQQTL